jgi:RNA polymerase sigma factor (sigma-70 family)
MIDEEETRDAELVALARSGSKEAFGRLVERYQPMAHHVALGMVANEDIARELAQEAVLQAYLSLDHLRDEAAFRSWLYGIVLNVCRSYIRDQKTIFFSLESLAGGLQFSAIPFSGPVPDPQETAEERELHRLVVDAVNALSPKNRTVVLMFYYDQLSLQEIAAILGVSVVAVKGRLHKARRQLGEQLSALYSELDLAVPVKSRRIKMVKVTIADVVKREQAGEQPGHPSTHYVIMLVDETGRRALPIWVGPWEGTALAIGLREFPVGRPLTFTFMANLLEAAGAKLEEVYINTLKEDTFYAIAKLRCGDKVRKVDARPSDAMALAVLTGSPIFVAEEVLERAGIDVPAKVGEAPQLGKGIDGILEDLQKVWHPAQPRPRPTKEEIEKAHQELVAVVFGSET